MWPRYMYVEDEGAAAQHVARDREPTGLPVTVSDGERAGQKVNVLLFVAHTAHARFGRDQPRLGVSGPCAGPRLDNE